MYKTKLPLFASKEKHVGKKHYLFLYKDFDRSKKLSQFTFNGQNFFLANTLNNYKNLKLIEMAENAFVRKIHILLIITIVFVF